MAVSLLGRSVTTLTHVAKDLVSDRSSCNRAKLNVEYVRFVEREDNELSRKSLMATPQKIDAECPLLEIDVQDSENEALVRSARISFQPDFVTYASLLRSCATAQSLLDGKRVHDHIVRCGFETDKFLDSLLVQMYIKCSALDDANSWFVQMHERNVFAWNFMLGAYVHTGQAHEVLQRFARMQQVKVTPDNVTFVHVLSACADTADSALGNSIHAYMMHFNFESDVFAGTALVSMYDKCGRIKDAWDVFNKMPERNVISWNAMIAAYACHEHGSKAFRLFEQMRSEGLIPDKVTFVSILSYCASQAAQLKGKDIHTLVYANGFNSDIYVATAIVNMYGKCGNMGEAFKVFSEMQERNEVSWNALIAAYAQNETALEAHQLFSQMQQEGVNPDKLTFISILAACASSGALDEGQRIHSRVLQSVAFFDLDMINALVNMYGKCGSLDVAQMMFERLPQRNIVSFNAMIAGYSHHGRRKDALQLFDQLQCEGLIPDKVSFIGILHSYMSPEALADGKRMHIRISRCGFETDLVVATALVNMYGKCSSLNEARSMFDQMTEYNVVSWNTMIAAYAQHGHGMEALQLFDYMEKRGFAPNKSTFVSVLSACAIEAALGKGEQMHWHIKHCRVELDVAVASALVNMYGKCGCLRDAQLIFDKMPIRDSVSWNTIIAAHAQHGLAKEALTLFTQMEQEGTPANKVTFISVLSACSHTGLVEEGFGFLSSMCYDYCIMPELEHYDCLIDLLGRVCRLDEAEELLSTIPFQPSCVSWMALLSACRYQNDVDRGKHFVQHLFELYPKILPARVMLSNIYATTGMGDEAEQIRNWMSADMKGQLD